MKKYSVRQNLDNESRAILKEYSDIVSHLLFHRGIKDENQVNAFLSPDYEKGIHDPFLLSDMKKVVERIVCAIKKEEKIAVFTDYDADGIPGAVVFSDFFEKIGYKNFEIYIPDRQTEGFGLNNNAILKLRENGATLLITVDCGVTNIDEVDYANSLGFEVIITDHHNPLELNGESKLPKAFAIVNPKISPDYPDKMLCGAAVAWKVISAILKENDFGLVLGWEKWLLDVVGIATLSDMVPLLNENRVIAKYGLLVLRKSKRVGLQRLLKKLNINQSFISEDDVGFMITPRINAASRMGVPYDAFRMLTTTDEIEADNLVKHLEKINNERKGTTAFLVKEVKKKIEAKYSPYFQNKIIVAGDPSWKPSLLGLVANSIAEKEMKPVFLWGREGVSDLIRGSCRSTSEMSLTKIMSQVRPGVFSDFGGHNLAGGFSVSHDTVHLLEDELERAFNEIINTSTEEEKFVDMALNITEVNRNILKQINALSPFGVGNEKPLFLFSDIGIDSVSFFGKEKNHLKIILKKDDFDTLEAICFFANENFINKAQNRDSISIIGNIESSFGNKPRIRIVDIV